MSPQTPTIHPSSSSKPLTSPQGQSNTQNPPKYSTPPKPINILPSSSSNPCQPQNTSQSQFSIPSILYLPTPFNQPTSSQINPINSTRNTRIISHPLSPSNTFSQFLQSIQLVQHIEPTRCQEDDITHQEIDIFVPLRDQHTQGLGTFCRDVCQLPLQSVTFENKYHFGDEINDICHEDHYNTTQQPLNTNCLPLTANCQPQNPTIAKLSLKIQQNSDSQQSSSELDDADEDLHNQPTDLNKTINKQTILHHKLRKTPTKTSKTSSTQLQQNCQHLLNKSIQTLAALNKSTSSTQHIPPTPTDIVLHLLTQLQHTFQQIGKCDYESIQLSFTHNQQIQLRNFKTKFTDFLTIFQKQPNDDYTSLSAWGNIAEHQRHQTANHIHNRYKKLLEQIGKAQKDRAVGRQQLFNQVMNKMIKHCGKIAKEENEDMGKGMGFKKNKTQCQIQQESVQSNIIIPRQEFYLEKIQSLELVIEKYKKRVQQLEKNEKNLEKKLLEANLNLNHQKKRLFRDFESFMRHLIHKDKKHKQHESIHPKTQSSAQLALQSKLSQAKQQTETKPTKSINTDSPTLPTIPSQTCTTPTPSQTSSCLQSYSFFQQVSRRIFQISNCIPFQADDQQILFVPQNQSEVFDMLECIRKFCLKIQKWDQQQQKHKLQLKNSYVTCMKEIIASNGTPQAILQIIGHNPQLAYLKKCILQKDSLEFGTLLGLSRHKSNAG